MIKLLRYLKGSAILYAILAPLFMLVEVSMDLMLPTMLSNIIDIGITNGDTTYVWMTGAKMIGFAVIGLIGGVGCSIFSTIAAVNLGQNLRDGLFATIQSLSFLELDHFKTSSLITRLTNDITQIQTMVMHWWNFNGLSIKFRFIWYFCYYNSCYFNLCCYRHVTIVPIV